MVKKNKKICIVTSSLGMGGAERSSAMLSIMLNKLGHEVHIVSVLNQIDFDFAGKLLNIGEYKDQNDSFIGRCQRFMMFRKFVDDQKFDLIIDGRTKPNPLKEFFIHRFLYRNQNLVHIVNNSKLERYMPKRKWAFNLCFKSVKVFVCVSDNIKNQIKKNYNVNNIRTIYNAVDTSLIENKSKEAIVIDFEYILYYGRLEDKVKNISMLIDAYKISKLRLNGVKLLILGKGSDKSKLVSKVKNLGLEDHVLFLPYTQNPFPYIRRAKFTALTSKYEGFPMVIPEALSLGVPVISVDCQTGPREIIETGFNGLLVESYDPIKLAEAMNSFIFDKDLYQFCRSNAKKSVERFSTESLAEDWDALINEVV